jgi:glucose-6-phosphate 1-dehydrogenase
MGSTPFVLFGATGDLAKKMLLPALVRVMQTHPEHRLEVIGVAGSPYNDESFREYARSVLAKNERLDAALVEQFLKHLSYLSGNYNDDELFKRLAKKVSAEARPVFYLAIPPSMFERVVDRLGTFGFKDHGRIMVEKPFGRCLDEALELSKILCRNFSPDQIYRIDHFLGKEAVQNLLVFRFANSILEPLWNRNYISRIELTMFEAFGVEGRGSFYDGVGVIRDVLQNHLLQLLALLLMEPPISMDPESTALEKLKALRAIEPLEPANLVLGQYEGYLEEEGVAPDSNTPTYVAAKICVNNWRWAQVPIYVRAGKALESTFTQAVVEFRSPPTMIIANEEANHKPHPNRIVFHFKPDGLISFELQVKAPGPRLLSRPVAFEVASARDSVRSEDAYAQLIDDVIHDDHSRFATEESVEAAWRVVDRALSEPARFKYPVTSRGPKEADALLDGFEGWCT